MRIDTLRAFGNFVIAMVVIVGGFVFLDRLLHDLQDPDLAPIDAATVGIVVGGVMTIISSVVTSLFTNESARGAARSAANATQTGVNAALTTPATTNGMLAPTAQPTYQTFVCPFDGLGFPSQAELDQHLKQHPQGG